MSEMPGFKKCPNCNFYYEDWRDKCPLCKRVKGDRAALFVFILLAVLLAALFGCALRPTNVVCVPYEEYQKMSLKECK